MAAGFFSTSFDQPLGQLIDPAGVAGYYVDLRVKASEPGPPEVHPLHVVATQWGLGAYEHWLHSGDERWLAAATGAGEHVLTELGDDGGLVHDAPYPHSYKLSPPWLSAMAQGQAASLLVRLYGETGEERMAEGARRALRPFERAPSDSGVRAELDGGPFFEEYPTEPPSFVLNGAMFALWGLRDAGVGLGDDWARQQFEAGVDTLAANVHRWDTGWWSRYDLFPHPLTNVASGAYHELHIDQLRAMHMVAPRPQLAECADRFAAYGRSRARQARAFAAKAAFRLRVPRSRPAT
jgi:hypothetical protein